MQLRRLLKNPGVRPEPIVADKLRSCPKAMRGAGLTDRHRPRGLQQNDRAENSPFPSGDQHENSRTSRV